MKLGTPLTVLLVWGAIPASTRGCPYTPADFDANQAGICSDLCDAIFACNFVNFIPFPSLEFCKTSCEENQEPDYEGILGLSNLLVCDGSCDELAALDELGFLYPPPPPDDIPPRLPIATVNIGSLGCDAVTCGMAVLEDEYGLLPYITDYVSVAWDPSTCLLELHPADGGAAIPYHVQLDQALVASQADPGTPQDQAGYYFIGNAICGGADAGPGTSTSSAGLENFAELKVLDVDGTIAALRAIADEENKPVQKVGEAIKGTVCSKDSHYECKGTTAKPKKTGGDCKMKNLKNNKWAKCMPKTKTIKSDGTVDCYCGRPGGICPHLAVARSLVHTKVVRKEWPCIMDKTDPKKNKFHPDFIKQIDNLANTGRQGRGLFKDEYAEVHTKHWSTCEKFMKDSWIGSPMGCVPCLKDWCDKLDAKVDEKDDMDMNNNFDCLIRSEQATGAGHVIKITSAKWDASNNKCIVKGPDGLQEDPEGSFKCTKKVGDSPTTYYIFADKVESDWKDVTWTKVERHCFKRVKKEDVLKTGVCKPGKDLQPFLDNKVGSYGDPHVKTWGQESFDYMGQCDLVLVSAANFDDRHNLTLHVRTRIRYDYSYIESAALQIGPDVLEVASFGDYAVNGVETPNLGNDAGVTLAGYKLHHTQPESTKHFFDVVLGPNENITLSTYKDLVSISINDGAEGDKYFANSVGMMGSYSGELLARDGTVIEDMNAFGQEWQVREDEPKLFRTARDPQYPSKCILPAPQTAANLRRRLGETVIAENDARDACARFSGVEFDNCVTDVMTFGDIGIAGDGRMGSSF